MAEIEQKVEIDVHNESRSVAVEPGPMERRVVNTGLALFVGGSVVAAINPEIGNLVMGAGTGMAIGGLCVGFAGRHGNG